MGVGIPTNGVRLSPPSAWTGRSHLILEPKKPVLRSPYPEVVYFKDIPVTSRKTQQRGVLTIRTLPSSYLTNPPLIAEGTQLYNQGWNPEGDPTKASIFHITEEQFVQAATNSPGGVIAAFVRQEDGSEKLVGAIWALNLDFSGRASFWRTYDGIVNPNNYFGNHLSFGNSRHCVSVVVKKEYNGFLTDEEFWVGNEKKRLSIGQLEVLAQRAAVRRSAHTFILFADSRPSSLRHFIEDELLGNVRIDENGRVFIDFPVDRPVELRCDRGGVYFVNLDGGREYFVDLRGYFQTKVIGRGGRPTPFDQMVAFHAAGLGGTPFIILPYGRTRTFADGRKVIDEDSLGFNLIFKFNPFANIADFMADLSPEQQLFVKTLARYLLHPKEGFAKASERFFVQAFKWLDYSHSFQAPAFQKTVVADVFSIEKARALRAYLRAHPQECQAAAEFEKIA